MYCMWTLGIYDIALVGIAMTSVGADVNVIYIYISVVTGAGVYAQHWTYASQLVNCE